MLKLENLEVIQGTPLCYQVDLAGARSLDWIKAHQQQIDNLLQSHGALLLRGLKVLSSSQFGQLLEAAFNAPLLDYSYRSTPRTELRGSVYTATEYHSDHVILQHNENAYADQFPMRLGFVSMNQATEGGETPIGNSCKIFSEIPQTIKDEFIAKGVTYHRNYGSIDLPWQEVFNTSDKQVVEQFCQGRNIGFEWRDNEALKTWQTNPAVRVHPVTRESLWFNQAHLFHYTALPEDTQQALLASMAPSQFPRHVTFGDGTTIDPEYLNLIRKIFQQERISFEWQKHDVLLLDNMLWTHGRNAFKGVRKTLVGMASPY